MRKVVGFRATAPVAYRIYNILFATFLLIATSPTFIMVALALLVTQGPAIFYRGPRIGMGQRQFNIIKFRTLCTKRAKLVTADRTLPPDANIETPLGKILRETRLDELPQLFNIIRGDMNICGPRPVRAEIAAIERVRIPDYDLRFEVRPGLIGPTQACFGHGTSKKIRARMNNIAVKRPVNIAAEVSLLYRIGMCILEKFWQKISSKMHRKAFAAQKQDISLFDIAQNSSHAVHHIDRISVYTGGVDLMSEGHLLVRLKSGAVRRAKIRLLPSSSAGNFNYEPIDEKDAFVIERYALGRVIIPPKVARISGAENGIAPIVARKAGV